MNLLSKIKKAGSGETYLKVLLTGASGSGKTTSIVYGCPKPALVIDLEDGTDQYGKVADFDVFHSTNHNEILELTRELLQLQAQGKELPYKSIAVDSGTVLYNSIKKYFIKQFAISEGNPDKFKLEATEYDAPKNIYYEIIQNLKSLKTNLFITAHATDNYLKGSFMQIDPSNPIKPDIEKRTVHELDVHIILKQVGKRYKAEVKKSRLVDKDGNNLLPAAIDNFDNRKLIPMLIELANKDKGFIENKPEIKNVIRTDGELSNIVDEILEIANNHLRMPPNEAAQVVSQVTNGKTQSPYQLTKDEAMAVLSAFKNIRDTHMNAE